MILVNINDIFIMAAFCQSRLFQYDKTAMRLNRKIWGHYKVFQCIKQCFIHQQHKLV